MRIDRARLNVEICGLKLNDPFLIASSHLTATKSALKQWVPFAPSALTLKTCMRNPPSEEKGKIHTKLKEVSGIAVAGMTTYCDGPKQEELLKYEAAAELLKNALALLRKTKVGVSVLASQKEDYEVFRNLCDEASFFELNLKYAFRLTSEDDWFAESKAKFESIIDEIQKFCKTLEGRTVFVKLPRELLWLPGTKQFDLFLAPLKEHGQSGLIIANSLKADLPTIVSEGRELDLTGGVICGEYLLPTTLTLINRALPACHKIGVPIIATGGMIGDTSILRALKAGATAVQLCTIFDYETRVALDTMRSVLRARISIHGLDSVDQFRKRLANMAVADMQHPPTILFDSFWSDDLQRAIKQDIRRSKRMDVLILSGHTLFERWREVLRERFSRNLGIRIFALDPDSDLFATIQRSWGMSEPLLGARRTRVRAALDSFQDLWLETKPSHEPLVKDKPEEKLATFELIKHQQCPFYSAYVFDGTAYVSSYLLSAVEGADIPAALHFQNGRTYLMVAEDLRKLATKHKQTISITATAEGEAAAPKPAVVQ